MYIELTIVFCSSIILFLGSCMVSDYMIISYERDKRKEIVDIYPLTDS
jgi:hypothetical protein